MWSLRAATKSAGQRSPETESIGTNESIDASMGFSHPPSPGMGSTFQKGAPSGPSKSDALGFSRLAANTHSAGRPNSARRWEETPGEDQGRSRRRSASSSVRAAGATAASSGMDTGPPGHGRLDAGQ